MAQMTSPAALRAVLKHYGLRPKKGLGQHFLWQTKVVEQIADAAELDRNGVVVEIGPGLGIFTQACARRAGLVISIEIDLALFPILKEMLKEYGNVRLVLGDARRMNFDELVAKYALQLEGSYKIVGNLPYYLTTPLIMWILEGGFQVELLVFMVQREVAARLVAKPGGKDYGSLSVAVQYYTVPELLFTVSPRAFFPPPEVISAVVRLRRRVRPAVEAEDESLFFRVVRAAFCYRRKTIRNSLLKAGLLDPSTKGKAVFKCARIDPCRRGETLSLTEFACLANALNQVRKEEAKDAFY